MIDMLNLDQAIKETAFLKGSPMGENMDYRQTENQKIYKNDPGLPMHADLFYYNQELEIGTVQTKYRQYANELAKMASYYEDPTPHINGWNGEELTCKM